MTYNNNHDMKKITLLVAMLFITSLSFGQYLTEDFEGGTFPPTGWTTSVTNPSFTWVSSTNANNGTGSAEIQYDPALAQQNETLISPAIDLTSATAPEATVFVNLSYFWAVSPNDNYDVTISARQGATTTPLWSENDLGVFTSFTWIEVTLDLSAYAGQSNVFLEINYTGLDGASLNVDDIVVEEAPACDVPNGLTFTNFTDTTADISWTNSGNFDVEYGVFPYTQGSGGITTTVTAGNSIQLSSLTPGVSYNVFIRQNCGAGLLSAYEEIVIGTRPATVASYPFTEDLEPAADQALILNLGLTFLNTTGNWSFNQDDLTDGDTTNDYASSPISSIFSNSTFTDADSDATVFIGPFSLTTGNNYTFSFQQRNIVVSGPTTPNKDIEIVAATTTDGTTNTVLATFDDMNNIIYQSRMGVFTPTVSGDYYFGIRDKSAVLTGVTAANIVFVDDITLTQTLGVNDIEQDELKFYYDQINDNFNVELNSGIISDVAVYNLLGQMVVTQSNDNNVALINMTSNSSGVYIARVTANGATHSIKFIKE